MVIHNTKDGFTAYIWRCQLFYKIVQRTILGSEMNPFSGMIVLFISLFPAIMRKHPFRNVIFAHAHKLMLLPRSACQA